MNHQNTAGTPTSPDGSADIKSMQRVPDEYKILQDKIDKIGAFKFTIKGWSVTVVVAAFAAGKATDFPIGIVSVGLALVLWYFFFLELHQVRISNVLGERVRKIEARYRYLERKTPQATFPSPYIGHTLALAQYKLEPRKKRSRHNAQWKMKKEADIWFYVLLSLLTIMIPFFVKPTTTVDQRPSQEIRESPSQPAAPKNP